MTKNSSRLNRKNFFLSLPFFCREVWLTPSKEERKESILLPSKSPGVQLGMSSRLRSISLKSPITVWLQIESHGERKHVSNHLLSFLPVSYCVSFSSKLSASLTCLGFFWSRQEIDFVIMSSTEEEKRIFKHAACLSRDWCACRDVFPACFARNFLSIVVFFIFFFIIFFFICK